MDYEAALDELFAAAPEDFVAARKRLVAALRAAGDGPGAKALGTARKPSASAAALNRVAREQPDAVAAWLAATDVLRDVSARSAEAGGDALRAAMTEHRAATARLRGVVRAAAPDLSEPMHDRVGALLQAATSDPALADALRAARLVEPSPARTTAAPAGAGRTDGAAAGPDDRPIEDPAVVARRRRIAELEARAQALLADVARLDAEHGQAARAAQDADARAEEARRRLRRAESEAGAAHTALTGTEAALADAEDALRAIRDELAG